jgi:ABC-type hemin transport system substrate-binding protein
MSILSAFIRLFRRKNPMAQVDFTDLNMQIAALTENVGKLASAIGAPTDAEQRIAQLEAELAQAQADAAAKQADLDASQAAEADLAAKFKAQNDAIAALLPPAA